MNKRYRQDQSPKKDFLIRPVDTETQNQTFKPRVFFIDPPQTQTPVPLKKFGTKKIIATILFLLLLMASIAISIRLTKQSQDWREKANWCKPDPENTDLYIYCKENEKIDCPADGKERICKSGSWHTTGSCCMPTITPTPSTK